MDKELLLYHYFSNRLTVEQERIFAELLETDSDFKEQFDFEQGLKRVIREKEANSLKAKLDGFEKDISKKDIPVRTFPRTNYRKWAMAASIALFIGLGWLGYNQFSGPDYTGLYNENFQEYPSTVYALTRGDNTDNSLERKAFVAYEAGENVQAIVLFKELIKTKNTEDINFYLAQSYLKNGQPKEAVDIFSQIIRDKREFAPQALWYAAFSYLKTDQKK